ncbi:diacylglycerol kinase family lipid kinase [bacterium]|nr:MAG: diacylglycerol kinase family lipid kinase [bacterium]
MVSSPVVILNPAAGRGARSWPHYETEILKRGGQIRTTQRAGEAHALTLEAIEQGAEVIVAAGGDGTLGEVAGAVLASGKQVQLGVLPIGTGNDFARTLGIWGDPQKAVNAIFDGDTREIDMGRVEVDGKTSTFINVAGCGFDSLVARRINQWGQRKTMRHVRGLSAYLLAVACELSDFHTFQLKIELDGERLETSAVLCAVANAQSYGGGMKVCPDAELGDGFFDVCLIENVSRLEFLRAFPGVFAGKHTNHPKVTMRRCRSIRIESQEKVPVLADGEIIGTAPFVCQVIPKAIKFCIPRKKG